MLFLATSRRGPGAREEDRTLASAARQGGAGGGRPLHPTSARRPADSASPLSLPHQPLPAGPLSRAVSSDPIDRSITQPTLGPGEINAVQSSPAERKLAGKRENRRRRAQVDRAHDGARVKIRRPRGNVAHSSAAEKPRGPNQTDRRTPAPRWIERTMERARRMLPTRILPPALAFIPLYCVLMIFVYPTHVRSFFL